jgi:hypothetical protein
MNIAAQLKDTKPLPFLAYLLQVLLVWLAYCYVMPTLLPQVSTVYTDPALLDFFCFMYAGRMIPRLLFKTLRVPKD